MTEFVGLSKTGCCMMVCFPACRVGISDSLLTDLKYEHYEGVNHMASVFLLTSWVRKTVVKEFSSIHRRSNS